MGMGGFSKRLIDDFRTYCGYAPVRVGCSASDLGWAPRQECQGQAVEKWGMVPTGEGVSAGLEDSGGWPG